MDADYQFNTARATHNGLNIIGTVCMLAVLSACGKSSDNEPVGNGNRHALAALKLNALQSCDAYKTYVTDALVEQYRPRRGSVSTANSAPGEAQPVPAAPGPMDGGTASADSAAPTQVTGTNNQETGVDEPDIVKTDAAGNLYIARGNFLRIVAGHPPTALKELAALDAGGNVYDLFLDEANKRAVLFAAQYGRAIPVSPPGAEDAITLPGFYQPVKYVVSFVDVANLAQPVLTTRWTLDGVPLDARRVTDRIHFVLSDALQLPANLANDSAFWKLYSDYYNTPNAEAAAAIELKIADAIRASLAPLDATQLLPQLTIAKGGATVTGPLMGCADISAPKVLTRPSLLTVASFDTDGANLSASAITAYGATVYASPTNLYVTQSSDGWFNNEDYKPQTAIHQFSVAGGVPKYVATGAVDGTVRNSFNLSEYNGDLRVATNTSTWSNGGMARTNDLFILRDNGSGELALRSAVRDFGKDEMLFSARFLGARGFVVTFRQVDPLFAFDLSDPDQPKLAGELTIPGFSTYMHPLGDNHLLTIGRDDSTRGMQLQIFDVADLANPKRAYAYSPPAGDGYSYSDAEYDHHAFTFDEVNKVLAIPLSYWNNNGSGFNGIAAFNIDIATGIKEITRVDHADMVSTNCDTLPPVTPCNDWYMANPRRSVIMTADSKVTLYSISDAGVKATGLAPIAHLGSVVFPVDPAPPIGTEPPIVIAQ